MSPVRTVTPCARLLTIMPRLPVYVINLDRRPDRLGTISVDLHRLGLSFERVPAVDARLLPPEDKADPNPLMRAGSKACMLSHSEPCAGSWRRIAARR